ncbi:MAG: MFS transporter [Gemmatimonadota bacterium]|nr:MFS transporter [Gemmatimonadota bacterium]
MPPALRFPLFRRFWFGLLFSVFGFRMFQFAQFWLAYELTGSALWLGFVGVADATPAIILNLVGGTVADRVDRRRMIMWTELAAAAIVGALGLLVWFDKASPWHVLVAVGVTSGLNAFNAPARLALYPGYVERKALLSAVALNSAAWQISRIVGPAFAGLLIAVAGTEAVLSASSAGLLGMVYVMKTLPSVEARRREPGRALREMLDGLQFIRSHSLFVFLIGITFFNSFFLMSFMPLMPVFAVDILDVGATGQGVLVGVGGVGSLMVTLWISTRRSNRGKGAFLIGGATMAGASLVAFSLSSEYVGSFPLALGLIFAVGTFSSMYMISVTTSLQLMVPNHLRGRVMGFWSMTWNIMPLGAMFAGALAQVVTVPWAVAVGGFAVMAFALGPALLRGEVRSLGRTVDEAAARAATGVT